MTFLILFDFFYCVFFSFILAFFFLRCEQFLNRKLLTVNYLSRRADIILIRNKMDFCNVLNTLASNEEIIYTYMALLKEKCFVSFKLL